MAETIVTFHCGHTGTLPVDANAAQTILRVQAVRPAWRSLCPTCRPHIHLGEGDR